MIGRRMPDSILVASKKATALLGLRWTEVRPVYKALQDYGMLPTSRGRRIASVQRVHIARLLVAVACSRAMLDARDAWQVALVSATSDIVPTLVEYLSHKRLAKRVHYVSFHPDYSYGYVYLKDDSKKYFSLLGKGKSARPSTSLTVSADFGGGLLVDLIDAIAWGQERATAEGEGAYQPHVYRLSEAPCSPTVPV